MRCIRACGRERKTFIIDPYADPRSGRPVPGPGPYAPIRETSAERRMPSTVRIAAASYAVCATDLPMRKRSQRGPLASRRAAAVLAPATERQDLAQRRCASRETRCEGVTFAANSCSSGAPRDPGRCAGGVDARTARRNGGVAHEPRPQEPHSLRQSASPVDVP